MPRTKVRTRAVRRAPWPDLVRLLVEIARIVFVLIR